MKSFLERWDRLCNQNYAERFDIPRFLLFAWWALILGLQTLAVLLGWKLFVIYGGLWIIVLFMFHQFLQIWKKYYSPIFPIVIHALTLGLSIYCKVSFL